MTQTQQWERQPGESTPAFEAFACYRDQGTARSTAAVGQALGKSKALMDRWSSRHGWVARAAAWDAHLERQRLQQEERELLAARRAMLRRHRQQGETIGQAAARLLLEQLQTGDARAAEAIRALEAAAKLEAAGLALPTETVEHRVTGEQGVLDALARFAARLEHEGGGSDGEGQPPTG